MITLEKNPTPSEVLKYESENLLCTLNLKAYDIIIYLVYTGSSKVRYYMFLDGKLLFKGNDFRPSPLHGIDSIQSVVSLLGFLTVQEHDTDPEYFKDYTPEQLEWSNSGYCEAVKGLVSDYEDSEPEYKKRAQRIFKKAFKR